MQRVSKKLTYNMAKYTNYDHFTENDVVDIRGLKYEQLQKILDLNPTSDCTVSWIREHKSEYYRPKAYDGTGAHSTIEYATQKGYSYKIHSASNFIDEEWTPKWGEDVEGSDDGERWFQDLFVGMNPDEESKEKFVCSDCNWRHIRPFNPRIAKIKAEIQKLQEELKSLEQ